MTIDPISKALERARKERQSVREWVRPGQLAPPAAPFKPEVRGDEPAICLDARKLHENHLLSADEHEDPIVSDRYRLLRTRVLQTMRANGWRSLGVTSPGAKAGKTVTSINLAISIAREGNYEVLLLDADIRNPSAAEYLGVDHNLGLPDYLDGRAELKDILIQISEPSLSFISGKTQSSDRPLPDILKHERMGELLSACTVHDESQIVVVDLPPVLVGDDVIAVSANLDAMLLVVDEQSTEIDDLKRAVELLSNVNLIGTVLNNSVDKSQKKEGYYGYHYAPASEANEDLASTMHGSEVAK